MTPTRTSSIRQGLGTLTGLPLSIAAFYIALFATAFWAYTFFWQDAPIIANDTGAYLAVANELADFHIERLHNRTPGYPLLLILTGYNKEPGRTLFFVSLLLHFASIWMLAAVLNIARVPAVMLIVFSVLLLLPPYVENSAYVLTESLSEFMLTVTFSSLAFWYIKRRIIWVFVSSLAIGYAALTRPTYQALALVVVVTVFAMIALFNFARATHRETLTAILILICGSGILIGSYSFFNYKKFNYFGMTPLLPLSLASRTAHVLERLPDEYAAVREVLIRARDAELIRRDGPHTGYHYHFSTVSLTPELVDVTGIEWPELAKYLTRMYFLLILKAPFNYFIEVARSFGSYWLPTSGTLSNMDSRFVQFIWAIMQILIVLIFFLLLMILTGGSIYIWRSRRSIDRQDTNFLNELYLTKFRGFLYALAGSIVMYSVAISCLFEDGDARYRTPTDGLIIFMCFLGIYLLVQLTSLSKISFCYSCKS